MRRERVRVLATGSLGADLSHAMAAVVNLGTGEQARSLIEYTNMTIYFAL